MSEVAVAHAQYKDSGIPALGPIPQHWQVQRIKDDIVKIASGVTPTGGADVYVDEGTPFLRSQNVHDDGLRLSNVSFITEEINSKMRSSQTKPGDIVLNITGASIGRSCIVPDSVKQANISQHILLLRFKKHRVAYAAKYIQSCFIKDYIDTIQVGASKQALNMGQTLNFPLLLPPQEEQAAITEYLDHHTAAIDRKIDLLGQKIKLYQTLRKTLINEAVCRGLHPHVPRKDSSIEWIGEVPAHWQVKRLKDVADFRFSNVDKKEKEGETAVLLCNYVDVYKNDFIVASLPFMPSTASEADIKRFSLRKGDVIITKDSESFTDIAVPALVKENLQNVVCGYHLALIRAEQAELQPEFLFYLFKSSRINHGFAVQVTGITRVGLGINTLSDSPIFLPPIQEQEEIAAYLAQKTQQLDAITTNLTTQITTFKELRKTLINDVVTGKLNVTA